MRSFTLKERGEVQEGIELRSLPISHVRRNGHGMEYQKLLNRTGGKPVVYRANLREENGNLLVSNGRGNHSRSALVLVDVEPPFGGKTSLPEIDLSCPHPQEGIRVRAVGYKRSEDYPTGAYTVKLLELDEGASFIAGRQTPSRQYLTRVTWDGEILTTESDNGG